MRERYERDQLCMFSYCLTWGELNDRIDWAFDELNPSADNNNADGGDLWFDLPLGLIFAFLWAGFDTGLAPDRDGTFWTRLGQVLMIFTGGIAAWRSGVAAIDASILGQPWTADAGKGHSFAGYGMNTFVGNFLGLIESVFTLMFLGLSARAVLGPLMIAYRMDQNLQSGVDQTQDLTNLLLAIITSMGAFFGGEVLLKGVARILDYFNNYDTGAMETGRQNTVAFIFDIGLHSVETLMYLGIAYLVENGMFHLVTSIITGDQQLPQ